MNRPGGRAEETEKARRTNSASETADAIFYGRIKRAALLGTPAVAIPLAAALLLWTGWFAVPFAAGAAGGIANAMLSMRGNERLLQRGSVAPFVISSLIRIALFGIVPVILAVRVPSVWTLGWYFIGFFTPLALSGISAVLGDRLGG